MKKFNLSLVAVLVMSAFAVAGGDIAPVEPVVETPVVVEDSANDDGFYLGLAYSATAIDVDGFDEGGRELHGDDDADSFMVQAGYKFNPYIAVEGRYWNGNKGVDAYGLYAKPMYPVTDAFDVYGLLGYGNAGAEPDEYVGSMSLDDSTFQWGLGASYAFTESFAVFIDYVELYNSDVNNVDWSLDTWNLGVTYQF